MPKNSLLWLEFMLLCVAVPGFIILGRHAQQLFFFLWAATIYGTFILWRSYPEAWKNLWSWKAVNWPNLKPILIRWLIACVGMAGFLLWYDPGQMFSLVSRRPEIVPVLLVAYPILSALPQELVFCNFFFNRYQPLFKTTRMLVAASAITFAYAHMLYINPVAPTLSLLGGYIFATTYAKHRSLALVTIEHALYGNALFIIGLGKYFFRGNVPLN